MNIEFIPIVPNPRQTKNIVETLTLQEVFEKYGHLMTHDEKMNLIRIVQETHPKHQEYMEKIKDSVDAILLEELLNLKHK